MKPKYKIALEVLNFLCNNPVGWYLAAKMKLFDAVFVMYPADDSFADHFTFRFRQRRILWRPFVVGWIKHPSGKRTLMFAISARVDSLQEIGVDDLRLLHERTELIRGSLGAASTHFAGTLPGRFAASRVSRGVNRLNEREATQKNVVKAVLGLRERFGHGLENPVVVLGSAGYIGKGVTSSLKKLGISVLGIDKKTPASMAYTKPEVPYILLNIASPGALDHYVHDAYLEDGVLVLNEVYPGPDSNIVKRVNGLGAQVFHLAGVRAEAYPPFPGPYQGAVPCCAALPDEGYEVMVIEL